MTLNENELLTLKQQINVLIQTTENVVKQLIEKINLDSTLQKALKWLLVGGRIQGSSQAKRMLILEMDYTDAFSAFFAVCTKSLYDVIKDLQTKYLGHHDEGIFDLLHEIKNTIIWDSITPKLKLSSGPNAYEFNRRLFLEEINTLLEKKLDVQCFKFELSEIISVESRQVRDNLQHSFLPPPLEQQVSTEQKQKIEFYKPCVFC